MTSLHVLELACQFRIGHTLQVQFDTLCMAANVLCGSVVDTKIQSLDTGRRITQAPTLNDCSNDLDAVDAQATCSGCVLRASSRSTDRIITEGSVSALSILTIRWRKTASLNLKPCSSSCSTS